jgi:hypothetical protein
MRDGEFSLVERAFMVLPKRFSELVSYTTCWLFLLQYPLTLLTVLAFGSTIGSSTISVMIIVNIYLVSHLATPTTHAAVSMTNTVFANAMACRVFREVWLDARNCDDADDAELKTLSWEVAPGPARVSTGIFSQSE